MRKWSAKEKAKIVLEVLSGQRTVAEACRAYGVAESLLYRWQREFLETFPRRGCPTSCRGLR